MPPRASGTLFLADSEGGLSKLDMATGAIGRVSDSAGMYLLDWDEYQFGSFDGAYFAFTSADLSDDVTLSNRRLRILGTNGKDVVAPLWKPGWGEMTGWTADDRLILADESAHDGTMIVVDFLVGTTQSLPPTMPNLNIHDPISWYIAGPIAVYDPHLTRAVYRSYPDYILWDVRKSVASASIDLHSDQALPVWAPDGSKVLLVGTSSLINQLETQLIVMGNDGRIVLTLHLQPSSGEYARYLDAPRWSPGGSKIAAWVATQDTTHVSPKDHFVIIDAQSGQISDYCLSPGGYSAPRWSPDGRLVALHGGYLVDTLSGRVFQAGVDGVPLAWLRSDNSYGN